MVKANEVVPYNGADVKSFGDLVPAGLSSPAAPEEVGWLGRMALETQKTRARLQGYKDLLNHGVLVHREQIRANTELAFKAITAYKAEMEIRIRERMNQSVGEVQRCVEVAMLECVLKMGEDIYEFNRRANAANVDDFARARVAKMAVEAFERYCSTFERLTARTLEQIGR
jgi:hypothetical protein